MISIKNKVNENIKEEDKREMIEMEKEDEIGENEFLIL